MCSFHFVGKRLHLDDVVVPVNAEKCYTTQTRIGTRGAARVLQDKDPTDVAAIMFLLPDDQRTRIFSEMDPALVRAVLKGPFAEELDAARQGRNGRAPQRP